MGGQPFRLLPVMPMRKRMGEVLLIIAAGWFGVGLLVGLILLGLSGWERLRNRP